MKNFRALTIAVDGTVAICDWDATDGTLDQLQIAVDGLVDVVGLCEGLDMWVNDEGIVREMPMNVVATVIAREFMGERFAQAYFGPVVFTGGCDDEGETLQLTDDQATTLVDMACRVVPLLAG